MARNTVECQEMIKVCSNAGVPLYVAYYRRRLPNFEKLKSLIAEGAIGKVRAVKIELLKTLEPDIVSNTDPDILNNWRTNPSIAGGGYFFDLASHQLDYLDYIFGPIESAHGFADNQAGKYAAADIIQAVFKFENGVIGLGSWCFTVAQSAEKDEMLIIGSEGQLRISFFGEAKIHLESANPAKSQVFEFEMPKHIQYPFIQTIVDDLLGIGTCPSIGTTAIRTNWVMKEMTKNYYSGN